MQINGVGIPSKSKTEKNTNDLDSGEFLKLFSDHSFQPVNVNRRQITVNTKPTTAAVAQTTTDNENTEETTPPDTTTTSDVETSNPITTTQPDGSESTDTTLQDEVGLTEITKRTTSTSPLVTVESAVSSKPPNIDITKPATVPKTTSSTTSPTSQPITTVKTIVTTESTTPSTAISSQTTTHIPDKTTPESSVGNANPETHHHHIPQPHHHQHDRNPLLEPQEPSIINVEEIDEVPFDVSDLLVRKPIVVVLENPPDANDDEVHERYSESNIMRTISRKITKPVTIDENVIRILPENRVVSIESESIEDTGETFDSEQVGCEKTIVIDDDECLSDDNDDEVIAWNRYLANWLFFNSRFWFGD